MRFGAFLAPWHAPGESPTVSFERDLELVAWLDRLGYDEAWIGEHHSTGWEIIPSPEIFIAVAAERTKHIRLGAGVISLPYHHPFMAVSRMVFLDHLTRGRIIFGVGPGAFVTDARMLGIDPEQLRPRMAEALDIVVRLLRDATPLTYEGEWFTLRDAFTQLRSYQRPHIPLVVASTQSPIGMTLAGKYGAGVLSFAMFAGVRGAVDLKQQWAMAEESAARHGQTVRRSEFRLVAPVYVADTRSEAMDDIRDRATAFMVDYSQRTLGRTSTTPPGELVERMIASGKWIVGTPDDAVAAIQGLQTASGGFGALMISAHEWATREKTLRSYELFARYVMPRFQGSVAGLEQAQRRAEAASQDTRKAADHAIESAHEAYAKSPTRS